MHGKCLCGAVEFSISTSNAGLYQCHCSLCQKQSGSVSNTSLVVTQADFQWLRGQEQISTYQRPSGFRSDFCRNCGCPVPNQLRGKPFYWVPAGLLETDTGLKIIAHLYVESKAPWDEINANGLQFASMPELDALLEILHKQTRPD
jgi:hypothetical protein